MEEKKIKVKRIFGIRSAASPVRKEKKGGGEGRRRKTDGAAGDEQPSSRLTSDCRLLWRNNSFLRAALTTRACQQQGKLTRASLLFCLTPAGRLTKATESSGKKGRITRAPVSALTDSCHMSGYLRCRTAALRGPPGAADEAADRGQQRASVPARSLEEGSKLTGDPRDPPWPLMPQDHQLSIYFSL